MANPCQAGDDREESGPSSSSHLPSTNSLYGLPTPVTATARSFHTAFLDPMADTSTSAKGKNKRTADEIEEAVDNERKAFDLFAAPKIVRRYRHRRRNVAASVWGPTLPKSSNAPRQRPFNVYKMILRHPNLFFQFALRLPPTAMHDLYAIDKEFHYRLNKYSVSIIHDYAQYHAPDAAYIFSWVLFPELCISDPLLKPMDGRPHLARDVPGLRWTKMVMYRDGVVRGILTQLGLDGHRVPKAMNVTLMKFWVLMELKTTVMRQAFLRDPDVWSDKDIMYFQLFLMKLDMRFSCPVQGNGMCDLSHMLLTQKTLTTLFDVLTGKLELDYDEATDMLVRTYTIEDLDIDTHAWLDDETENGVPEEEWGLMCLEGWHMDGRWMEPVVDMVITEGIQRSLHLQQYYLDFLIYGFVDGKTGKNVPAPRHWRGDKGVVRANQVWPLESEWVEMRKILDKRFGVSYNVEKSTSSPSMRGCHLGENAYM